jgi:23S rRNA pseudouridine2605 synthase
MNQSIPNDVSAQVETTSPSDERKEASSSNVPQSDLTTKPEGAREKSHKRGVRSPHGMRRPRPNSRNGEDKVELISEAVAVSEVKTESVNGGMGEGSVVPQQRADREPRKDPRGARHQGSRDAQKSRNKKPHAQQPNSKPKHVNADDVFSFVTSEAFDLSAHEEGGSAGNAKQTA